MPPGVFTVTSTVPLPAVLAGLVTVICVSLTTFKLLAAAVPNSTLVAPVNLLPLIVIVVPPASGPDEGEMLAIVGIVGTGAGAAG